MTAAIAIRRPGPAAPERWMNEVRAMAGAIINRRREMKGWKPVKDPLDYLSIGDRIIVLNEAHAALEEIRMLDLERGIAARVLEIEHRLDDLAGIRVEA